MAICKLNLDNQTLIIIISSIVLSINFRLSFNNINYHMDCGNFYSLSYDPILILIKNILCVLFLLAYYFESKINKENNSNNNIINENDISGDIIGEIESIVLFNKLYEKKNKSLFILKVIILIIFIYACEELHFIVINNHILDRLICSIRNIL